MISYKPLWDTLKNKEVTQYQLIHSYGISAGQLSRVRANNNISTHTGDILCEFLYCKVEDLRVYVTQ